VAVLLGLASALVYGAADFLGGMQARRSGALAVVVWSQLAGLALLLMALPLVSPSPPRPSDLGWGALGGVGGGAGVALLYRGLSVGRMSVVAPVTAAGAAVIPVLVGISFGERPGVLAVAGVALALAAIVGVSSAAQAEPSSGSADPVGGSGRRPGLAEAMGAGLGFALFFICLDRASDGAGLWPLLAARTSVVVAWLAAVTSRACMRPAPGTYATVAAVGAVDMLANLLYLQAVRAGLLSLVVVLVSLYPVSTVVLARVVLAERLTRVQLVSLGAAASGVALIAVG
jgi:drug/metabolite transporter (DMT)-like permease